MAKPITIPNTFASATSAIPLAQLDQDFSTLANSTNDLATYSNYVADTGAADAFIANYPANTNTSSLTTGLRLQFKAANANTGASTLNVQVNGASIGTASIRLTDGSALPANTIIAGALVDVMYDGTNFQIMNDPSGGQEIISNLTLSGNLTVAGTSTFTGNVTGNVVNTTTSTITNLTSSNVTITGGSIDNISITNLTSLTVDGDTTLGDASGDTLTINGTTVTTPNGLNFDSNTFVIDATNNYVGIGTATPEAAFHVRTGSVIINGTAVGGATLNIESTGGLSRLSSNDASNANFNLLQGTNNTGVITFSTRTGTVNTERMRITNAGNVGIGTSSPTRTLSVYSSSSAFSTFQTSVSGTTSNDGLIVGADGSNAYVYNYENTPIIFGTNNAERMRIDSSGNVGIGTSSPGQVLEVSKSQDTETQVRVVNANTGSSARSGFVLGNNSNAGAASLLLNSSNNTGLGGANALNMYQGLSAPIAFFTNATERMRIDSSGNVLVGTTAGSGNLVLNNKDGQNFGSGLNIQKNGNGNPNYELVVGGDNKLYLGYSATTTPAAIGNFATNGTYTATSDIRKKKDISYTFNGLDIVNQLKPVQGRMLDDEENSPLRPMFIAQDMVDVLPSVVSSIEPSPNTDNPLLGIDYASIVPVICKAIQEQQAMIEELKQEVAALKAK